jgi:lipoyl(octanoyl) transferase
VAGRRPETLLLCEHDPVITLGRSARAEHVLVPAAELARRGVTVAPASRGGDVTYHGPGQLVGYPIFDLRTLRNTNGGRMGPVDFVRQMEEALIRLCGVYGVQACRIAGLTGVWCLAQPRHSSKESKKIGAIGIHVSRGITSHGFAFNVTTNLDDFRLINPCGITDRPVTSLEREVASPDRLPTLESIAPQAARQFGIVFGEQILAIESLDALRAQAQSVPPPMPQDTPLQVPPELERLKGLPERPVRA